MSTPANALNIRSPGITIFDGTATFTATTTTQFNTLVGGTANTIGNVAPGLAGQVLTSNGAVANPTYQALPFVQRPWVDIGLSFNALAGTGFFVTASAVATLPPAPVQGNTIAFTVDGVGAVLTVTANVGQSIRIGSAISVVAGVAVSNAHGDSLTLVYRASDATWLADEVIGTWSVT